MIITFNDFYVNVTENNVHIHDSYKIKGKKRKLEIINAIIAFCPEAFKTRTIKSVLREWRAHNVLYKLHIARNSTMHTDIEAHQKLFYKISYLLINIFGIE
jgi:hypothetical protein